MESPSRLSWISDWFRWSPTSMKHLEEAEKKMFSYLKKAYELNFIPISTPASSKETKIRSLVMKKSDDDKSTPLVLLHGFGSGVGLWILNLSTLSEDRTVYAPDILGFGHSSRPKLSNNAEIAENQLIESIEEWRKGIGLKQFILLGHSMGGFLAASYAIKYPERIKHLILADPWGFPVPDLATRKIEVPFWVKIIAAVLRPFNPLAVLRLSGPYGPRLVKRLRPDILHKFESVVEDLDDVSNYIYHCNAQYPSGESAFKAMTAQFGWANRPMIERIPNLEKSVPITFIYGSHSWIDSSSGYLTSDLRKNSYVDVQMIQDAGHHVYADKAGEFNNIVNNICKKIDQNGRLFIQINKNMSELPVNTSPSETEKCIDNESLLDI